jgi:acetyl esterase/lipase
MFLRLPKLVLLVVASPLAALVLLAACAPTVSLNALASISSSHTRVDGIPYGPLPRHKLDIYRPAAVAPAGGWPVVVFFYGGSWNRGERADYRFVGEALASRGVLALIVDYRLYPEVRYPAFLGDCAQALAYGLREAAALGGNPKRVFVMGHSAGAYNAAMLALDARWLQATGHSPKELAGWVGLAGPYDFLPIHNPDAKPVFFHPSYPAGSQAIDYARRDAPPGFLAAPAHDELVDPQRNTVGLAMRLRDAGAPVTLKVYERVDHMTIAGALAWPLHWLAPVLDDVSAFVTGPDPTPAQPRRNGA